MGLQSSWILLILAGVVAVGEKAVECCRHESPVCHGGWSQLGHNHRAKEMGDVCGRQTSGAGDLVMSEICFNDGLNLQCTSGHVVHVQGATCGGGDSACPPEVTRMLLRLCEGVTSCAGLGLRDLFSVHCHTSQGRANSLVVNFTCEPEPDPPPACRTNLCSDHSHGLRCPEDSVVHVRKLTCLGGLEPCSWATYITLYSLCESRVDCDSSGLRMLMPAYCNTSDLQLRNVFVDYLCVPKDMVFAQCGGEHRALDRPFGLLMNPAFMGQGPGPGTQCRWLLSPGLPSRRVVVTVHVAHIKWGSPNCTETFLQVRYKDCDTLNFTTKHFCDLRQVNTPLTSCGPVDVSSGLAASSDQADRFLVSYQILDKEDGDVTPANMSVCSIPLVTSPPSTPRQTTRAAQTGRNYGPAGTMFDYSDTIRHTGDDSSRTEGNSSPVTLQLKLLVLYVFFGVVIIALVIALVYVLVSYHGISRRKRPRGDSSEKDALWRQDETPLDTFNHNSHNSLADLRAPSPATAAPTPDAARSLVTSSPPDSQVEATVHVAAGDPQHIRFSSGSGFSSFLSPRDSAFWSSTNPYANVGDIDMDVLAGRDAVSAAHCADNDTRTATAQSVWSNGYLGQQRSSDPSNSPMTNGDFGDIYESIDHRQPLPASTSMQNDDSRGQEFSDAEDTVMERVPLMGHPASCTPPPSPPFPPPPPPLLLEDVPHYVVNEDEYAVISKARYPSTPCSSPAPCPAAEYSNLLCLAQDDSRHNRLDPAYVTLDTFREDSVPVVDFRPASGPYDRDRSGDRHTSPGARGTRHQWNDDL